MISIRPFGEQDVEVLHADYAPEMSVDEIFEMIHEWDSKTYNGKTFEMYAVISDQTVVGMISLYEHSKSVAGIGPRIFEKYRRCGYASKAMSLMESYAKEKGYRILQQQVSTSNIPSREMHSKLGYETNEYVYKNKKGGDVVLYLKAL